jgi:hypothetical protein
MSNVIEDIYHYIKEIKIDKENGASYIYADITPEFLNPETIGNYNKETAEKYKIN